MLIRVFYSNTYYRKRITRGKIYVSGGGGSLIKNAPTKSWPIFVCPEIISPAHSLASVIRLRFIGSSLSS